MNLNQLKTWVLRTAIITVFIGSCIKSAFAQKSEIVFNTVNYDHDTLVIGYYYGDRTLVFDTLERKDKVFKLESEEPIPAGMYLSILKPDNNYFQMLVPKEDQQFNVQVDGNDIQNPKFIGSTDNELFSQYVSFIVSQNQMAKSINEGSSLSEDEKKERLTTLNQSVLEYQDKILNDYPFSLTAMLIKANVDVSIPEFKDVSEEEKNILRYRYYKDHFFDNMDMGDSTHLRMPYLDRKVKDYIDRLTPQHPDSIIQSIDRILNLLSPAQESFRFYLSTFLNEYTKSKIVGMDAIVVHLSEQYYGKGKAPWIDEESLEKILDNARFLKPTLIGRKAQNITTFRKDGTTISLYDLESAYTILYIYAYDCGHCKKATPKLVEFYENNQDLDVGIFTICTKPNVEKCWEFVDEKKMDKFINTVDPSNSSRFRQKFDVRQTPKVYLLDKEKEILIKNFPLEDLEKILDEIIKMEEEGAKKS